MNIAASRLSAAVFVAALVVAVPVLAEEIRGKIKSIDRNRSEIVVADERSEKDVTVSLASLRKGGKRRSQESQGRISVTVDSAVVAAGSRSRTAKRPRKAPASRSSRSSGTISGTTCSSRCCCSSTSGFWFPSSR